MLITLTGKLSFRENGSETRMHIISKTLHIVMMKVIKMQLKLPTVNGV